MHANPSFSKHPPSFRRCHGMLRLAVSCQALMPSASPQPRENPHLRHQQVLGPLHVALRKQLDQMTAGALSPASLLPSRDLAGLRTCKASTCCSHWQTGWCPQSRPVCQMDSGLHLMAWSMRQSTGQPAQGSLEQASRS